MSDYLNMSDEDFLKEPVPTEQVAPPTSDTDTPPVNEPADEPTLTGEPTDGDDDNTPDGEPDDQGEGDEDGDPEPQEGGSPTDGDGGDELESEEVNTPAPKKTKKKKDTTVVERTAETDTATVDKLFAPFKASGVDMQVRSVDEAIQLMQMGANYQKKMQTLKPKMRLLQSMERHQFDEEKLNFALDLLSGNKEAIHKLVTDHSFNSDDLYDDDGNTPSYVPTDKLVSQSEMDVRAAFEQIETSPHIGRVQQVLQKDWDTDSANEFVKNPSLIINLEQQMQAGHFDIIQTEMMRQRTMYGQQTQHLNDLQLYCAIGEHLVKQGQLKMPTTPPVSTPPSQASVVAPKPKKTTQQPQSDASKVAPSVRKQGNAKAVQNYLNMSDEDFMKLGS